MPAYRLYVAGAGRFLRYCTATCRTEAIKELGEIGEVRVADPDDLRAVWKLAKLETLPYAEIEARFKVGRQTVLNWRKRAGGDLPRRSDVVAQDRHERIKSALTKHKRTTIWHLSKLAGVSTSKVREVAEELGVPLRTARKRPSDAELIELAKGRTWPEFAEASGLKLATLRTYIYSRPELSQAIRKVRKDGRPGNCGKKKVSAPKIRALHKKGLTAYAISQRLGVEQMAVRYWFRKLGLGGPNDVKSSNREEVGASVGSSNGRAPVQS